MRFHNKVADSEDDKTGNNGKKGEFEIIAACFFRYFSFFCFAGSLSCHRLSIRVTKKGVSLQQEFYIIFKLLLFLKCFFILTLVNKTARIIIVVIVLILLGGGAFYLLGKSASNPLKSAQNQMTQMTTQKKSLSDFFSMTGSLKCTFSDKTDNSSGTVYAAVGKMRGDFQSADNGKTTQTHMVNDGSFVYMWTDGQKSGYKMSLASIKNEATKTTNTTSGSTTDQSPAQQGVNMQKQSDYSCGPWAADKSLFTVPTDVTFTDYTSMMQGATGASPQKQQGITSQQKQYECSQCDQVPAGSMRNQCRAALKCQ